MSINWKKEIPLRLTTPEAKERIRDLITAENYGFKEGQWTLTDIITMHRADFKVFAKQIIEGVERETGTSDMRLQLKDISGQPLLFKIRVLTRQACDRDRKNNPLGLFDKDTYIRSKETYSKPEDIPQPGDVIKWPGEYIMYNSDGTIINQFQKMEMRARGVPIQYWYEYVADNDLTISVPYMPAIEMLQLRGKRLVNPEFARVDKNQKRRTITNWFFEEVPRDYKLHKRTPKTEPTPEALTGENNQSLSG